MSEGRRFTLADLKPGQSAVIVAVDARDSYGLRLLELGLRPGERVQLIKRAPFGDPIEVRVMDYDLCLRQADARLIALREIESLPSDDGANAA